MEHKFNEEELVQLADSSDTAGAFNELMKPGTLVVYKGGGYDGCFWEWNTFIVTAPDTIVEIHSSGRKGVWAQGYGYGYLERGRQERQFSMANFIDVLLEHDMAADLNTQEGRREINGFIACYALAVARKLADLDLGYDVELQCCECGKHFDSVEEFLLDRGYDRGDGGVGIVNDHLVCSECYYETMCTGCGERYEEGEEIVTSKGSYCEWCVKQARKKFSEEEEELYERLDTDILQLTIDSKRLGELRPENKEVYARQANELICKLQAEMAKMVEEYL